MKRNLVALIFILVAFVPSVTGQSPRRVVDQTNAWFMYFGSHKFTKKLGLHAEAQLRRADVVSSPQQLLLRTGLNYHFSPDASATMGYAYVLTYPYGELPVRATFPEHRLWEQVQLRSQFGRVEFINRLRLEQRFSQLPVANPELPGVTRIWVPGDAVYTNRARPMIRASIPFKGKTIGDRSLYLSVYEEPFISFGKNVGMNIFDQNRAYVALGYKIPKWGRLEVGYLNQKVFKGDGINVENNHTLQLGLSSAIALRPGL